MKPVHKIFMEPYILLYETENNFCFYEISTEL